MTQALLITQCLQNDFVKPIRRHEALPNALHIGTEEARRLMGDIPAEGPVARMMEWAYGLGDDALKLIHLRDWHDSLDIKQMDHLAHFGLHCEADTPGADFAFPVPENHGKEVGIINTPTLNDFFETPLAEMLAPLAEAASSTEKIKVGLMGVWTEAKITYLAYELSSRYPQFELGVCSSLTAGSSRAQHFVALENMQKLLGVKVFHSLAAFVRFLGGQSIELPLTGWSHSTRPVLVLKSFPTLDEVDSQLVRYLFRDSRVVKLKRLSGGYSGSEVMGSQSRDQHGHRQVSHVVKIGWHHLLGKERVAFEQIESVLGNNAPRIVDFVELGDRAALKYRYASMSNSFSQTFQSLYQHSEENPSPLSVESLEKLLYTVFIEQLGRLYAAAQYERQDLLAYYEFTSEKSTSVRRHMQELVGDQVEASRLRFPDLPQSPQFPNLSFFYEKTLPELQASKPSTGCYMSFVHGDLNGANIMMDDHENVWLIDFFHTHRGHVLRDLIKLENDILYLMTPLESDEALLEALELTRFLMQVDDLRKPLPALELLPIEDPHLRRAYQTVRILRSFYSELIHSDRNPLQLFIGQLRYAAHTLSFPEAGTRQKKWALYTASLCAQEIESRMQTQQGELWVSWLSRLRTAPGRLGLTLLPGRRDRHRILKDDIESMKKAGVTHIVPLLGQDEMADYGVPNLLDAYKAAGFEVYHLPIVDQGVTSQDEMYQLIEWIQGAVKDSSHVLLHCVGGLGRSGMVAASYLRSKGLPAHQALAEVRSVRSPRAIETEEQEAFVAGFEG